MDTSQPTSPLWEQMHHQQASGSLLEQALGYAQSYLHGITDRAVFPTVDVLNRLHELEVALPNAPQPAEALLQTLHEIGSPATTAQIGGRYFGFVNGGAIPAAVAAKWLADVWDQNSALYVMSPIVATLEQVCERWLIELFGLPSESVMGLVGGTSTATLCGLAAGRFALLQRLGWDVNEQGLFDAPRLRVVMSQQAHASVKKGLAVLGFGKQQLELVPMDEQGRLRLEELPPLDDHTLVILQAGNVNTGAFEDFVAICERAQQAGAWVHIDGAFGLWAHACTATRYLTNGIEHADSWSVDGHKTLNTPYDCGIVLCKDRVALTQALQASGAYLQLSDHRDGMFTTLDMSRRARAVELWATLAALGREGMDAMIGRLVAHAQHLAHLLTADGFIVLNEVVFNQVLVCCAEATQTSHTLRYLQQSGEAWCGGTTWNGQSAIRVSVCSWATETDDIERTARALHHARELAQASNEIAV